MLAAHRTGGEHVGLAAGDTGGHFDDDVAASGDAAAVAWRDDAVGEDDLVAAGRGADGAGKRHARAVAVDAGRAAQAAGGHAEAVGQGIGEGDTGDVAVHEVVRQPDQEGVGVTDVAGALVARRAALADPEVGQRGAGQQARREEKTSESNPQQAGRHSWTKHHSETLRLVFRPENQCAALHCEPRFARLPGKRSRPANSTDAEHAHCFF